MNKLNFKNIPGNVLFQSGQFRFCAVKITDLCNDNYDNWNNQRFISEQHVNELTDSFLNSINNTMYIKYSSGIIHIVLTQDGKKYVIDGQHRIEAYKKICRIHNNAYEILVLYEQCCSESEIKEAFKRSNTQWTQPDDKIEEIYNNEYEKEGKTKQDTYCEKLWNEKMVDYGGLKGIVSRSNNPRKPNICENKFFSMLKNLENQGILFSSYNKLKEALDRVNENVRQQKVEEYSNSEKKKKIWEKCLKYNCFIGLVSEKEFYEIIFRITEKRKAVPIGLKKDCWRNKFLNESKGYCEVCSKVIEALDFEAGHIISVYNGGKDVVENLMPICKDCNRSMNTQNLYDYKNNYFLS